MQDVASKGPFKRVLLTGDAAFGKSTVLRVLTQVACNDYFNGTGNAVPLPIYAPLQQSGGEKSEIRRWAYSSPDHRGPLLDAFMKEWARAANEYIGRDAVSIGWLEDHFQKHPTLLIIDSLDELLLAVAPLELVNIQNMMGDLNLRYGGNPRLTVVLGVRYTQRNIEKLVGLVEGRIRLLPLDEPSTWKSSRGLSDYLTTVRIESVRRLFFNPLIASALGARQSLHPAVAPEQAPSSGGDGPGASGKFDLRLLPSIDDANSLPKAGRSLIIVADVNKLLYFRIFDSSSDMVVDVNGTRLPGQARRIDDLASQLATLWPPHMLTGDENRASSTLSCRSSATSHSSPRMPRSSTLRSPSTSATAASTRSRTGRETSSSWGDGARPWNSSHSSSSPAGIRY